MPCQGELLFHNERQIEVYAYQDGRGSTTAYAVKETRVCYRLFRSATAKSAHKAAQVRRQVRSLRPLAKFFPPPRPLPDWLGPCAIPASKRKTQSLSAPDNGLPLSQFFHSSTCLTSAERGRRWRDRSHRQRGWRGLTSTTGSVIFTNFAGEAGGNLSYVVMLGN